MKACEVCAAVVSELRRGRCWGCYTRWSENRPVGLGATCGLCGERRRDYLRSVELLGAWMPMCHGCAARAMRMSPLPQSVPEIRRGLERDRRAGDRRGDKADGRVFRRDRRDDERRRPRALGPDDPVGIDDEMIVEIMELGDQLESEPVSDLTRIRQAPRT